MGVVPRFAAAERDLGFGVEEEDAFLVDLLAGPQEGGVDTTWYAVETVSPQPESAGFKRLSVNQDPQLEGQV